MRTLRVCKSQAREIAVYLCGSQVSGELNRASAKSWVVSFARVDDDPMNAEQVSWDEKGGHRKNGAGDEIRTRDINLGKVALYQLSYSRFFARCNHCLSRARLVSIHAIEMPKSDHPVHVSSSLK